jgi:hypothetical protein
VRTRTDNSTTVLRFRCLNYQIDAAWEHRKKYFVLMKSVAISELDPSRSSDEFVFSKMQLMALSLKWLAKD